MDFIQSDIKGLWVIQPKLINDNRGYFTEIYKKEEFEKYIGPIYFIQENQSRSSYGVLRGLHYQEGNAAQAKLITVLEGKVQDVALDIRSNSNSFGHYKTVELSAENKWQLFIPRGFAHGFLVLSPWATVNYKTDNSYNPNAEKILYAGDEQINISWSIKCTHWKQSKKDQRGQSFQKIKNIYERDYFSRR